MTEHATRPAAPMTRPYGTWPSPISIDLVVAGSRTLGAPWIDGEDVYVLEGRPDEGGRVVLMRRRADGAFIDVTPAGSNVRTRAHEYGGGAYTVHQGVVVYSEFSDDRLHVIRGDGSASEPLTPARMRFADMRVDARRDRVVAVLEDHHETGQEPRNLVCAVSLRDGSLTELVGGHDFYSDPRLDPAGARLCWLSWDRPNMPWDGSQLWMADLDEAGALHGARLVAGGPSESIVQPTWAPDGSLVFASDRSGWWNIYRWRDGDPEPAALAPMAAEFAGAQWVFGQSWFSVDPQGRVLAICRSDGRDRLLVLEEGAGPREIQLDATELYGLRALDEACIVVGGSPTRPTALLRVDLGSGAVERLRETSPLAVDPAYLSVPRHIEFPTAGGRTAFAWYYPPANPDVRAPQEELPPLVVSVHGGPTADASTVLDLGIAAFTSRGFAFVDVDYGGSTGYGRAYRDRLLGQWGVVDLDDCTNVATWLAEQGLADRARLAIRGGSAGGFTTLAALCHRDVFAAGASWFGVGDLEALARFTHKFESRYLDRIVAPYPDEVEVYRERSPIHFADRIGVPVLILQGADDMVVPQAQADDLAAALRRNGIPHAYLLFEGEGHGFRRADSQKRSREAELSFYAQVFGFELAGDVEPIALEGAQG